MKRGFVFLLVFFILMASVNIVSSFSSENIGNLSHSITTQYGPSEHIKGWINISLENEPTNSLFEINGDPRSLIDLLNKNTGFQKTCNPLNCETDYSANNPQTEKTFSLDKGESTIFGFKFTGDFIAVDAIKFTLVSDAHSSCDNQLKIDFFNDGIIDVRNNKIVYAPLCGPTFKSYGCFNEGESIPEPIIDETPYCQRIRLTESPGFKLGAWVKKISTGGGELKMELYDNSGVSKKTCTLPMDEIS